MAFENLSEVESINRKGNRKRKKPRPAEQRPEKKLPVIDSFPSYYPQAENGLEARFKMTEPEVKCFFLSRLKLFQEFSNPCIVMLGRINSMNDLPVAADKFFMAHHGLEVDGKVSIVSG